MTVADLPDPDRVEGAPHPRDTPVLVGQDAAEAAFLQAHASGRLHHGWLITGPRGVGKATLAWRIARFLLSAPAPADKAGGLFGAADPPATAPASLDVPPDHPVARRIAALSEARLFLLRRSANDKGDRLSADIRVGDVRRLRNFFEMSVADGGRRVVIVDAADEMNPQAANALLKMLEEPPRDAVLLLVAHQPARLLPTIRSRCRELRCATLTPEDMARALTPLGVDAAAAAGLAALTGGSVGAAVSLAGAGGLDTYGAIAGLMAGAPGIDRQAALALADSAGARGAAEGRFDLIVTLIDTFLARLARAGVTGPPGAEIVPGEAATLMRLAPGHAAARHWAEVQQGLGARARRGRAVNLDPAALVLDMLLALDAAAQTPGQR